MNLYLHKKQLDQQKQRRQDTQRKSEEELKQSTKFYKIYCGVEYSRARYLKKAREYFQPS